MPGPGPISNDSTCRPYDFDAMMHEATNVSATPAIPSTVHLNTVPPAVKKERSARLRAYSDAACLARWRTKIGREDTVLVDRPGRGYGDDYCPWRVDGPVGSFARVRGAEVTEEGIVAA